MWLCNLFESQMKVKLFVIIIHNSLCISLYEWLMQVHVTSHFTLRLLHISFLLSVFPSARRKCTNPLTNNLSFIHSDSQVLGEYGMAHFSDQGKNEGKDYCIFFNSQWARLPQDLSKAVSSNLHFTHTHAYTHRFRL